MKDTGPERYTIKHLDAVATKLRSMPPVDEENRQYTTEEMVKILSKDIIALQERGYTLDQVSKLLHAEGIEIRPYVVVLAILLAMIVAYVCIDIWYNPRLGKVNLPKTTIFQTAPELALPPGIWEKRGAVPVPRSVPPSLADTKKLVPPLDITPHKPVSRFSDQHSGSQGDSR